MAQLEKAKVFMSGRRQAARIPAQSPASLADIFAALDEVSVPEDFLSPVGRAQGLPQKRPEV
ncbi:MAG: hypothetical protein ABSF28_24340 [Terracidiphilus sp.]|jgi:hypothetical protein